MTAQLDFFSNTIGLLPSEKIGRESNALTQTEKILRFFEAHPNQEFTPCEVWQGVGYGTMLLTSVRRSISNATKAGDLVKTGNRRKGIYGELNYTWTLNKKQNGLS
jgi:hypothetical protein